MSESRRSLKGQHIVVIGNGIAGNTAASAIGKLNSDVSILLISEERQPLYTPCAFYKYFTEEIKKENLFLKKIEDYSKEGIGIIFGHKVTEVDIRTKEIRVEDKDIRFDKLILATGSKALLPPISGIEKRGVFVLKTVKDAQSILNYPAKRIVVLGSGPIGMEVAMAFHKRGFCVSIVETLSRIMPRIFDEVPSLFLKEIVEDHGIKIHTDERATEILGDEAVTGLVTDKREMKCDMVIIAAGVRPNIELAKQAGIEIGSLGGIKTDDYMITNRENVFACGDCIESRDIITGESTLSLLWPNAKRQGRISGFNCAGERRRFIGSFDATNIEIFGTYALAAGRTAASLASRQDYIVAEKSSDSSYHRLIILDNRLVGMQLINKNEHAGLLFSKMLRKDRLVDLAKLVRDDKLLSIEPWNYWLREYI